VLKVKQLVISLYRFLIVVWVIRDISDSFLCVIFSPIILEEIYIVAATIPNGFFPEVNFNLSIVFSISFVNSLQPSDKSRCLLNL